MFRSYIDSLAHSLNNIIVSFDCTVILGGYLGEYLSPYIGAIREKVAAVGAALLFVKPFLQSV